VNVARQALIGMLVFAAMCATVPRHDKPIPLLEELTLDEKIGQLFAVRGFGVYMAESSPRYQELHDEVTKSLVGGVVWFASNVYETAELTRRLQREARVPLLISADLEAGLGMRFLDTTFWPPAMAVAATGDPSLAEAEGRVVAREARVVGVNHILAPVADVNVDPDNPVINARSFGEDPADVARFVSAFVRGVQSEHVLATAKHFPGHGDTHVDSHRALPVIDVTRERLERVELVPFRAAIDAGVKSVMIGHLAVPSLDRTPVPVRGAGHGDNPWGTTADEVPKEGTLPATISSAIVTGVLRKELGYDGLVVSDAFDMGGITEHFDAGEAAVRAIEAGEDQILLSANTAAAIAGVKEAVRSGRLSEARIDQSVRRILDAKAFVGSTIADADEIFRVVDAKEHRDVAAEIARRAVTLVREEAGALPLRRDARVALVMVTDGMDVVNPLADFEKELKPVQSITLDPRTPAEFMPKLDADVVIAAFAIRARSGAGTIALPPAARKFFEANTIRTIGITFGTPYLLREVPRIGTYLVAYGPQPVLQRAVLDALRGDAPITGKLPVTIPGLYPRGHGIVTGQSH
jgi:beta-glucosidase-like glycosyl hydrolase